MVTVSRLLNSIREAPATVYVVTADEIRASGAKTLWDALRGVPGVDVMTTRTSYGEISIRGLNKALSNRTLVLLDGRTILNGPYDTVYWEGISVTMEEIDRIEVVEGPISALYGPNAINGVINILTRTPEQLKGGKVSYTAGERNTHLGSFVYGDRRDRTTYKAGLGWRSTNRFEDPDLRASEVGKLHAFLGYDLDEDSQLSLSGGFLDHDTQFTTGSVGDASIDGKTGFVRADYETPHTQLRSFWTRGRWVLKGFRSLQEPAADSDLYEFDLEHTLSLSSRNRLVVGTGFRRNTTDTNMYSPTRISRNLWSLFFEEAWRPAENLIWVTSARLDRHSRTGWQFSPRGSLIFTPTSQHVFRLSAGTSFRSPTLTENSMAFTQEVEVASDISVAYEIRGNHDLDSERLALVEIAHSGQFGPLKTTAVGFHYRLEDVISVNQIEVVSDTLPRVAFRAPYVNLKGETRAWGGEVGVEFSVNPQTDTFVNYSYQNLSGPMDFEASQNGGPEHKVNAGFRTGSGGLSAGLWAHWVDETFWNDIDLVTASYQAKKVDSYVLINARIGYAFSGRLKGLEIEASAFNLADHEHFQILPWRHDFSPGKNGEIIRRRLTATAAYRF